MNPEMILAASAMITGIVGAGIAIITNHNAAGKLEVAALRELVTDLREQVRDLKKENAGLRAEVITLTRENGHLRAELAKIANGKASS